MAQLVARYLGVVEAARSSRVTQTKKPSGLVQNAQIRGLFLIQTASFLLVLHNGFIFVSERGSDAAILLRIFYEFIPESSTKNRFGASGKLRFRLCFLCFRGKIGCFSAAFAPHETPKIF